MSRRIVQQLQGTHARNACLGLRACAPLMTTPSCLRCLLLGCLCCCMPCLACSFAGTQPFSAVLDWVYAHQRMPLWQPGRWALASSFPRRQLAAAAGIWALQPSTGGGGNLERLLADHLAGLDADEAGEQSWLLSVRQLEGPQLRVRVRDASTLAAVKVLIQQQTGEAAARALVQHAVVAVAAFACIDQELATCKRAAAYRCALCSTVCLAGMLPAQQRLLFSGHVLEESKTLAESGVAAQHSLLLAPRPSADGAAEGGASSGAGNAAPAPAAGGGAGGDASADGEDSGSSAAEAEPAGAAGAEVLVVRDVAQLAEDVAHGAQQLALLVVAVEDDEDDGEGGGSSVE